MRRPRTAGAIAAAIAALAMAGCGGGGGPAAATVPLTVTIAGPGGSVASFADTSRVIQCALRSADGSWVTVIGFGALRACERLRRSVDQEIPWRVRVVEDFTGTEAIEPRGQGGDYAVLCEYAKGGGRLVALVEGYSLHDSGGAMCAALEASRGWKAEPVT